MQEQTFCGYYNHNPVLTTNSLVEGKLAAESDILLRFIMPFLTLHIPASYKYSHVLCIEVHFPRNKSSMHRDEHNLSTREHEFHHILL